MADAKASEAVCQTGLTTPCVEYKGYIELGTGYGKKWCRTLKKVTGAHRAVWIDTLGPIEDKALEVLHKCDNKKCVNIEHLYLGTHSDNGNDAVARGQHAHYSLPGVLNPIAKLDDTKVREIRSAYASGERQSHIADRYGVTQALISLIVVRKAWAHVE